VGGGTVSFAVPHGPDPPVVENDDQPILIVYVLDPGPSRSRLFRLYRRVFHASPARAKALLLAPRVEVARGTRLEVERLIEEFRLAGAMLEVVRA
jgi:hypothetical protein